MGADFGWYLVTDNAGDDCCNNYKGDGVGDFAVISVVYLNKDKSFKNPLTFLLRGHKIGVY